MNFTPITIALSYVEPILWAIALFLSVRFKNKATISAFTGFLAVRMIGALFLLGLSQAPHAIPDSAAYLRSNIFFGAYWFSYLAGCVFMFFALRNIFFRIMAPFAGLNRAGSIIFRWAAVISFAISVLSVSLNFAVLPIRMHLVTVVAGISCGVSVLVLCLLGLLAVCLRSLGQSYRSWDFGICLGSGVMAATELTVSASGIAGLHIWSYEAAGFATILALAIWITYLFIPEKKKQPVVAPASTLSQWNDLAQELGPNAQPQPVPQSGFLQNVESVVDRVLAKNSVGSAG